MEFKNTEDVVKFVLSTSNTEYVLEKREGEIHKGMKIIPDGYVLKIQKNFDVQRIYFIYHLCRENFGHCDIIQIITDGINVDLEEGYLSEINSLRYLNLRSGDITTLPKLPKSLIELDISGNDISEITKIDHTLKFLHFEMTNDIFVNYFKRDLMTRISGYFYSDFTKKYYGPGFNDYTYSNIKIVFTQPGGNVLFSSSDDILIMNHKDIDRIIEDFSHIVNNGVLNDIYKELNKIKV